MHLIVMDKPIHVRAACITTTTSFLMPVFLVFMEFVLIFFDI